MNMLNSLILEGYVSKGLETKPGFADFEIGVERFYKNADGEQIKDVSYFSVELYGAMTESLKVDKNIYVGRGVRIVGRLKQKTWKDEEGKTFSRIVVIAEHIEYKPKHCDKKVEETVENTTVTF